MLFCDACKAQINEHSMLYGKKKNGDLICGECLVVLMQLILNLLETDKLIEFLDEHRK